MPRPPRKAAKRKPSAVLTKARAAGRRTSVATCTTVPRVASGGRLLNEASKPVSAAMHVSPRPIRPPEGDPAPPRGGLRPVLVFALYAVLAVAGTLLLARHGRTPFYCGEDPIACGVP